MLNVSYFDRAPIKIINAQIDLDSHAYNYGNGKAQQLAK